MQNSKNSWTENEIDQLSVALTFTYKGQNTYKEPLDLDHRIALWKFVLEEKFTVEQVLYGLKKFLQINKDMPVPAQIFEILHPKKPRVTEAQFIAAQDWQKRNGYPVFSDARDVIDAYNAQEREAMEGYEIQSKEIKSITSTSIRMIENETE